MPRDTLSPLDYKIKAEIVNNLNDLKASHNYSQRQIVEGTGLSQGLISHYFLGRRMPTQSNIKKLADFFNVPVWEIDPRQKPLQNKTVNVNGGEVGFLGENSGTITFNSNKKDKLDKLHDRVIEELGLANVDMEQTDVNIHKLLIEYHKQLTTNSNSINKNVADLSVLLKVLIAKQEQALTNQNTLIELIKLLLDRIN